MSKQDNMTLQLLVIILFSSILITGFVYAVQPSPVELAKGHLQKACEIIWKDAKEYEINHCINRTMSALSTSNRLRDNELKRLLLASEKQLEKCQGGRDGDKK